jgi:predicted RNase H-like HicB family nuclease
MERPLAATVWREADWYVSQCLELDIASQGATEEEALANLKEALELRFESPQATRPPQVRTVEVEVGASYHRFMTEADPQEKGEAGKNLIRAVFGKDAIADDSVR